MGLIGCLITPISGLNLEFCENSANFNQLFKRRGAYDVERKFIRVKIPLPNDDMKFMMSKNCIRTHGIYIKLLLRNRFARKDQSLLISLRHSIRSKEVTNLIFIRKELFSFKRA